MGMEPIVIDSQTLQKTRTTSKNCKCCENSVKRRNITLIILLLLQFPILYFLYNSEITSFKEDKIKYTPVQSHVERSSLISATIKNEEIAKDIEVDNNKKIETEKTVNITIETQDEILKTLQAITTIPDTTKAPQQNSENNENNVEEIIKNDEKSGGNENDKSIEIENSNNDVEVEYEDKKEEIKEDEDKKEEIKEDEDKKGEILPQCPATPPGLQGPLAISFAHPALPFEKLSSDLPQIKDGGYFKPPYCVANDKVAIIIPFRDREEHLSYFLEYMHPILSRQQLEYRIYIINQYGKGKFNRAKLMNVGYAEALKDLEFGCFVFHDVDLILENDKSIYSCPERPRHLSAGVDKFNYKLPYATIFGGVTELTKSQMQSVNGYSNSFWGWGGEDDDMFNRLRIKGFTIMRYPMEIARYKMITHEREKGNEANPQRFDLIRKTGATMDRDGISSLEYKVIARKNHQLYTNVTVDLFNP